MNAPSHKGFGSTVLGQVMGEYFETAPKMEFAADGVRYEVTGLLDAITNQADPSTLPAPSEIVDTERIKTAAIQIMAVGDRDGISA